jgi:hypothetical protein
MSKSAASPAADGKNVDRDVGWGIDRGPSGVAYAGRESIKTAAAMGRGHASLPSFSLSETDAYIPSLS